jgi:hypothetical protein
MRCFFTVFSANGQARRCNTAPPSHRSYQLGMALAGLSGGGAADGLNPGLTADTSQEIFLTTPHA